MKIESYSHAGIGVLEIDGEKANDLTNVELRDAIVRALIKVKDKDTLIKILSSITTACGEKERMFICSHCKRQAFGYKIEI